MNVKEMFSLSGKTAVVTGGATGLGAQMAVGLAEAGANIVIAARNVERSREMCLKLEKTGVKALAVGCDVSNEDDCRNLIDLTVKEFGTLDILINNAGTSYGADSLHYPMDRWKQVFDLNVTGLFQLSALAAQVMKEQGGGKIINIASIGGLGGDKPENVNAVAYPASKGAVIVMTKDLAAKWARYGIYVNAVCPGWFPTDMSGMVINKEPEKYLARIPLNRFGSEEDLKGITVFLSSAASNYITGQCIVVDGGQTALI